MKTENLVKFFGGGHGAKVKIAEFFNISRAAVSKWGEDVPKGRAYDLMIAFPELANSLFLSNDNSMPHPEQQKHVKEG